MMVRVIDADALVHDLEYDVELCAMALDDMNLVGKEREDMQWQKDCKQNCIWYISEQPTVDAERVIRCKDCEYFDVKWEEDKFGFLKYENVCNLRGRDFIVDVNDYCSWAEEKEK